ncbi:MAG: hypothetical protein LBV04_01455, partial [Deferribacteraceae bacterium]|nr:hypothetical protein [Deferribacteraceae bacterium]
LNEATQGKPQALIYYFSDLQRHKIEQGLNLRDVTNASLEQVAGILLNRINTAERERSEKEARQKTLNDNRNKVGIITISYLHQLKDILINRMQGKMAIAMLPSNKIGNKEALLSQYAEQHSYYFNNSLPRGFIVLGMQVSDNASYQLLVSIHHYGYDDATLAIGAIFHTVKREEDNNTSTTTSLSTSPHIISIAEDDISSKEKNIKLFLEDTLSAMMAQIASEIN